MHLRGEEFPWGWLEEEYQNGEEELLSHAVLKMIGYNSCMMCHVWRLH